MKAAYISVYRDGTGYGNSAINYIKALDSAGVEVDPMWVTLNGVPSDTDERVAELEAKATYQDVDVCIQQYLPHYFFRNKTCKNVGMFYWETDHFTGSRWQHHCNLLDEIWVTTPEQVDACKKSGITVPVREIPFAHDLSVYDKDYDNLEIPGCDSRFKFYTICDLGFRKNVIGMLNAYYTTFTARDNVALIIRGYFSGMTAEQTYETFGQWCQNIKEKIGRPGHMYPPVVLIAERMSNKDIMRLHETCDVYVCTSRGEGENIPAFDAAGMGNGIIASNWNGLTKMLGDTEYRHTLIEDMQACPVSDVPHAPSFMYNCDEVWYQPSTWEVGRYMRQYYNKGLMANKLEPVDNKEWMQKFSHEAAGQELKLALEDLCK
jgi:glycosyltransferase involved in cell wall biosynthesis